MVTVFFLYGFNSLLLIVQKNKKIFKKLALIFFLALLVFSGHNYDYAAYEKVFHAEQGSFSEAIGLLWFFSVFRGFGIVNYKYVLVVIGLFVCFVFYKWEKYTRNIFYTIYLYMLFIVYYDIVQIRNTIIAFLTVYSLLLFIQGKNKLVALIPCIIAPLFHIMAAFTGLIVIYIFLKKPKKNYSLSRNEIIIYVFMGIIACFGKGIINFLILVIPQMRKASLYMTSSIDLKSFAIWSLASFMQIFVLWNYGVRYVVSKNNDYTSIETKRAVNILFRFALFSIPFSAITLWMDEVVRIFRLFFLVMFFLYAIMRDEIKPRNRRIIFGFLAAVNIIFMLVWLIRGINPDVYWG